LRFGVLTQIIHVVYGAALGFFLFPLISALGFIALFLLPRLLFLALVECGTASWHRIPLLVSISQDVTLTRKYLRLPTRFARLASMALIVIASAAATATAAASATGTPKALSTAAAGLVSLGLGFIDLQSAATEFRPVQRRDGLFGFAGVGHLNKRKSARASGLAISDHVDGVHLSMRREQIAQLRFGGGVGQVANVKVFH
jgi:hypothetical protein